MKSRVVYSGWDVVITALALVVLLAALVFSAALVPVILVSVALVVLCGAALFYMPLSLSADKENLTIRRPMRKKRIPLDDISSVELYAPTMGEIRLSGSGGWFGHWGWFKEKPIGTYFGYYGKSSDCFLVTLKDGKKYMLGCKNPAEFVDYLKNNLGQSQK